MKGNIMQERVTAQSDDFFDITVQFIKDYGSVGIGLEPKGGQHHFVDTVYGDDENLVKIGKIFRDRLLKDHGVDVHEGYVKSNAEEVLDKEIGRMILDSVTGSTPADGLWTWLDRPGCNRLVRLVRKAREVTFGRDE